MKNLIPLLLLLCANSVFAADSTVLREIMGKSVYDESGVSVLTEEQMKVLENWVLENAVEKRIAKQAKKPKQKKPQTGKPIEVEDEKSETKSGRRFFGLLKAKDKSKEKAEAEPRYVEVTEPEDQDEETEEEEPITQKYVRIDTLDEKSQRLEPDLIRSRIDGPFKGWRNNKTRFRLENGEIWEQRQSSTYITNLESPEVVIKKGRFGYTMEVPAIGKKVHVKRIR